MLCETVYLKKDCENVYLKTYVAEEYGNTKRDCMLILPGGGYSFCAPHEDGPVARAFLHRGFNCFTLYYSVGEGTSYELALREVSMAIAHIRANKDRYSIDPERIFVCGFSAGGHLTAGIGTMWDRDIAAFDEMKFGENRPAGMVVCYGASTLSEHSHELSRLFACGKSELCPEEIEKYSPEKNITKNTPPAFIWHTADDEVVDVGNALDLGYALIEKGIPTEMHIYKSGCHGLSVCTDGSPTPSENKNLDHLSHWVGDCAEWTKSV